MDGSSPPLRFKLSAIDHSATSPKNQDTITCSMSKIGIEPIRSIFGIAACVFQIVPLIGLALAKSWMKTKELY